MQPIKITYLMTARILAFHMLYCFRYTSSLFASIYLTGLIIMKIRGLPLDIFYFAEYKLLVILLFLLVYTFPINLYVTRMCINRRYKDFQLLAVTAEQEQNI